MVVYAFYETDSRVMMYSKALLERGDQVDVISLKKDGQKCTEVWNGARIYRIQKRRYNEKNKLSYLLRLTKFLILSFIILTINHLRNSYDIIHVHSVPDFEVFAALLAKLTKGKVILDIHDLVPEFYASKFKTSTDSFLFRLLLWIEKASTIFSDHVIIANHLWKETLTSRSIPQHKCTAIINYPDTSIFYERRRVRNDRKFIITYPGTLNWHQGVDLAIRAINLIKERAPEVEFHIHGEGGEKKRLMDLVSELQLSERVIFHEFQPTIEMPNVIANTDLGVVPKRASSFGNEAFSTKILEFMAMGVPVVVSDTKIDRYYFDGSLVRFFESENEEDLARSFLELIHDCEFRKCLITNGLEYVKSNNWDVKKEIYLRLIDSLKNGKDIVREKRFS